MFSAYTQEDKLNKLKFSIYFTNFTLSGVMYEDEISSRKFVEFCLCLVVSDSPSYIIRTPYFLIISLTVFFHTNHSSHATFWLLRCHEPRLTQFCSVLLSLPTCAIVSSISFTRRNREFLHNISLIRQGKRT